MISIRQLTGRIRLLVTALFAGLPVLVAYFTEGNFGDYDDEIIKGFYAAITIPLLALATATASFGNEVDDRTLSNLTLTPVPRWKLILPKLLAAITINGGVLLISVVLSVSLTYSDSGVLVAAVIASLLTIIAYSMVFLWLGLMTSRALITGLLYVFLWEFLFTNFVSGIRFLSIRAYMLGIVRGIDDTRFEGDNNIISFPVSIIVMLSLIGVFWVLSVRRLKTMDVP